MTILHINASITGDNSISTQLTQAVVEKLTTQSAQEVITYDLVSNPIPHMSGALFAAQAKAPQERTAEESNNVTLSEKVLSDFMAADTVVIGAPMYNFTIPSQLKAWIDRILVARKTFRYTENGAEGLVSGKRIIVISTRGSAYTEELGNLGADHQENYLKTVFAFIGIENIEVIRAQGVNLGKDSAENAIADAHAQISTL